MSAKERGAVCWDSWAAGQLWLARADGTDAHPLMDGKTCAGELSWAPGGRRLAFYQADAVMVYDMATRGSRVVLRYKDSPPCESTSNDNSLAWSPDGRRIAAVATWTGAGYPQILRLVIVDVRANGARTVTIRFARGALGGSGLRDPGSYPVDVGLTWTADGRHVLFMTIGKGMGWAPTGLWQAPAAGGMARLLIGSASGVRMGNMDPQPVPPLYGASHFALSPDRRLVALDPGNRLWVANADGTGGRFLNLDIRYPCGSTQFTWLADSSGLAYVREYYIPSGARFALYSIHLHGGRPRLLFKGDDGVLGALYLAPWQRSCGAGA